LFTVLLAFNNQKSPKSLIVAHYLLSLLTYFSLNATTELQTGALKMQDRKMQDLKMQDQIAGDENAGPENAGPNRRA